MIFGALEEYFVGPQKNELKIQPMFKELTLDLGVT